MENLNEVVQRKLAMKIEKGYVSADNAIKRLHAESAISTDFIHRIGSSRHGNVLPLMIFLATASGVNARLFKSEGDLLGDFNFTGHSIRQAARKLDIPEEYLADLAGYSGQREEWSRELASHILNEQSKWSERNRVLIRSVGTEIRGLLSDSYRRLDSTGIIDAHIEEVYANGGKVSGGFMDDTRVSIDSFLPSPIEVQTSMNGIILLIFGVRYGTSDYGDGASELRSTITQGVCMNGAVRESVLRAVHLGAKLPDNLALSEKTYRLDSDTHKSAIVDLTKNLYNSDVIKERIVEIKASTEMVVDFERELANLKGRILKGETEEIGKILMRNNPEEGIQGESTLWKLSQGISSYANRESVAERRRMELQEIAGSLFDRVKEPC
jgi:hypothetical protein